MAANFKAAGRIVGNPLYGLCDRMCIEVRQVFDGCTRRADNQNAVAQFIGFTAGEPYEFVSVTGGTASISDLTVTSGSNCSQMDFTLNVPLTLRYRNIDGVSGTATGVLRLNRSVTLRVPTGGLLPYSVEPTVVLFCNIGSFLNADTVSFTYCIVEIVKVIVPADILVPTYGYAVYPDCTECGNGCPGILASSLFPDIASVRRRSR